jgi:hypothetical protein
MKKEPGATAFREKPLSDAESLALVRQNETPGS